MLTRSCTREVGVFVLVSKDVSSPTISLCFEFISLVSIPMFVEFFMIDFGLSLLLFLSLLFVARACLPSRGAPSFDASMVD